MKVVKNIEMSKHAKLEVEESKYTVSESTKKHVAYQFEASVS